MPLCLLAACPASSWLSEAMCAHYMYLLLFCPPCLLLLLPLPVGASLYPPFLLGELWVEGMVGCIYLMPGVCLCRTCLCIQEVALRLEVGGWVAYVFFCISVGAPA
jgi:hypothetical protein